ncbi:uncharacterized protein BX664DRAFT_323743, partial [Halteromyces radiatus]|uniref:uncharacterized protein n=1 Tax=Halteromyces radiatus TaxID=101107 RepID=UPI00221E39F5
MIIHKSQGKSLGYVGVYLKDQVFAHGQLYVALSRSSDPSTLRVAAPQPVRNSQPQTAKLYIATSFY